MLSLHTSPLVQPGQGDGGGMNVYVRELTAALARAGVTCTVYTRTWRRGLPREVDVEPGLRVVYVDAGDPDLPKEALLDVVDTFTDGVVEDLLVRAPADVVHANYWLSGLAGHRIKHRLELPLVTTFHTLARVKAEGGDLEPPHRMDAEAEVIGCTDAICVSCDEEERQFRRLYGDPPGRIEIVAPAVEHAFFAPGSRTGARRAIDVGPDGPLLVFVGRIQPLKGLDVAVRALAALDRRDARLVVVGGASGPAGEAELDRVRALAVGLGVADRLRFVPPQPHHLLAGYYRAADVVLVPSRSESFGLVALEAAACGTPVVAAAVGGLRTLVDHGRTGLLVHGRDPAAYAAAVGGLLADPARAEAMGRRAAATARRYTWSAAASRLGGVLEELVEHSGVLCG
jgi:D-inositol-3-phosphate glycosyltransferase